MKRKTRTEVYLNIPREDGVYTSTLLYKLKLLKRGDILVWKEGSKGEHLHYFIEGKAIRSVRTVEGSKESEKVHLPWTLSFRELKERLVSEVLANHL